MEITISEARKIAFEILAEAEERRAVFAEEEAKRIDIWTEKT